MKSTTNRICKPLVAALALCLAAVLAVAAPLQGPPGQRGPAQPPDPLRPLQMALQAASAPELTADQAKQILSLIEEFRASTRPTPPAAAVQQARADYEGAILNGDLAVAKAQIPSLASEQISSVPGRLLGEATLAVGIVQVLSTNGNQWTLLQKSMNSNQLVRLLLSFGNAGGQGQGPGRGGRGPIK